MDKGLNDLLPNNQSSSDRSEEYLRNIASCQKGIIVSLLVLLLLFITDFLIPPALEIPLFIAVVVTVLVNANFVFLLSYRLFNVVAGGILWLLALIPVVNLIVMLSVSAKATSFLRQNGIGVGIFGARKFKH